MKTIPFSSKQELLDYLGEHKPLHPSIMCDPITKHEEKSSSKYSFCNCCERQFENNDTMVIETVGFICFHCLYYITEWTFTNEISVEE